MSQSEIDAKNIEFWDELCSTSLAKALGITDHSAENLNRFDTYYFDMYPYLKKYVDMENLQGSKVLEIGLGYGSLSQLLASKGCDYYGLDIADGPVGMARHRLGLLGINNLDERIKQGSALDIPFPNDYFDFIFSIGTIHHTGNLPRCIAEAYRVLGKGGKSLIMVYNRLSFRQIIEIPISYWKQSLKEERRVSYSEFMRTRYDLNTKGKANPYTDFVSPHEVKRYFRNYSKIKIDIQNFDSYYLFKKYYLDRKRFLHNIARLLGLDLYITAYK